MTMRPIENNRLRSSAWWDNRTVIDMIKRVGTQNNLGSLAAHLCGFLCAEAVPFLLTIVLVRCLNGSVRVIWIAYGVNCLLSVCGCLFIVGLARMGSFVHDFPQFMRAFRFAFITTLLMPILLAGFLFVGLVALYERLTGKAKLPLTTFTYIPEEPSKD